MEIIEKLPDDIVLRIYTKYLKRFRFHKGELIQLIDLNKYAFLEKYVGRKSTHCRRFFYANDTAMKKNIKYNILFRTSLTYRIERNYTSTTT